jgi:8-oxo-dGTP pyrophosphatase MutT (NUDIX family)
VELSNLIRPETSAGTALFLQWEGYHVFSIPQRELSQSTNCVRFFGVGGKRQADESLINCALRESVEEIGAVVSHLNSAAQTYFLRADGTIEVVELPNESIRPRLILEKRKHSLYGSMANQNLPYYLVAFDASLLAKPTPKNEIAGILYLKNCHLSWIRQVAQPTIAELLAHGAYVEYQPNQSLDASTVLIPHGTARFLMQQLPE